MARYQQIRGLCSSAAGPLMQGRADSVHFACRQPDGPEQKCRRCGSAAFTLVELLIAAAIVVLLVGIAVPVLANARLRAKVVRAHADLRSIGIALETYYNDYRAYPPARTFCGGGAGFGADDYNVLPEELMLNGYIRLLPEDVFNPGRTYKYVTPGYGYSNGAPTILAIWVPENLPSCTGKVRPYFKQKTSPVKWAVWSVGPAGPLDVKTSDMLHIPVPRSTWYDPSKGLRSEGVITHIRWTEGFIHSP